MGLTDEQLQSIESFAAGLMSVDEIAIILELDRDNLKYEINTDDSPGYKAHQRGYLMTKFKVNQKIIDLANSGSSPAQTMAMRLLQEKQIADGT